MKIEDVFAEDDVKNNTKDFKIAEYKNFNR